MLFEEMKSVSQFVPLPKEESEVCRRLAACRRFSRIKQEDFATAIGLTRAQLANIESCRVPLRFWPGWKACEKLFINQHWLATGEGSERPFFRLDLDKLPQQPGERWLFRQTCESILVHDLKFRAEVIKAINEFEAAFSPLVHTYQGALSALIDTFMLKVPMEDRAKVVKALKGFLDKFLEHKPNRTKK